MTLDTIAFGILKHLTAKGDPVSAVVRFVDDPKDRVDEELERMCKSLGIGFQSVKSKTKLDAITRSTLILVLKKLSRGESLTETCLHYDIRPRYAKNSYRHHCFKQDIGRLAGYV